MRWRTRSRDVLQICAFLPLVWACSSASPSVAAPPGTPAAPAPPVALDAPAPSPNSKRAAELEALGFDAYLWGFAIVENYKAIYAYNVNTRGAEYKGPFNTLSSSARVYTPADKAIITPNSDTPYGFATLDLRAEPQLLTVPAVEKHRYYSLQFVDAYTHNFAYVGTRTTGNRPGRYLVTGPNFKGQKPEGVDQVLPAESEFVLVLYRTQLFNPQDIENVKKVQAGYLVTPLHEITKSPPPPAPPALDFPVWDAEMVKGIYFLSFLDFLLDLMPVVPEDAAIRQRLLAVGVGAAGKLDPKAFTADDRAALLAGLQRGQKKLAELSLDTHFLGREVTAGDLFGNRAFLGGDVRRRDVGALLGIYGNSREEALYPIYRTDSAGKALDASRAAYTLRFEKGKLPPAKAFWSLTMYDGTTKLLVDNPLKRYLINSAMLPTLTRDADGGITLTLAHASPGKGQEANWLPAPNGPFYALLRIYQPEPAAYDGSWKLPTLAASSSPVSP
ncbi:MAG TPA: DUF1254 domain-containing protein [Polyangiaceae bacterium]|nr:DUF1254 domain-containing protein [Polyangiaceae bacterium]